MDILQELSHDKRLRNHFNIDKKRRSNQHVQSGPHFHPYYELYYLQEGSCRYFVGEKNYLLRKGELILVPPGDLHLVRYEAVGFHDRFTVYFDENRLPQDLLDLLAQSLPEEVRPLSDQKGLPLSHLCIRHEDMEEFNSLLNRMLEYYQIKNAYGEAMNDHLFPVLLLYLARHSAPVSDKAENPTEAAFEDAVRYLSEHFRESLTLEDAAGIAGFTPSYYSRKFKETVGLGFREYITHLRLKEGANLLRTTSLSIQEISTQVGFSSANYFGDVFRTMYHLSPRQYRKMDEVPNPLP